MELPTKMADALGKGTLGERSTEDLSSHLRHGLVLSPSSLFEGFSQLLVGTDGKCRAHVGQCNTTVYTVAEAVDPTQPRLSSIRGRRAPPPHV